ncbi:hypothetical protein [Nocardioides sp. B-3]|uniref:hypothetical protein n=1 Tax=Nocardioides sp. B-3 TaxID=2895565 RepID=UPI00215283FF|nr:hypothetical protein [Nocardioides sp. B-3]UUZ60723.1 hypothetical protein LP418_07975 [Nocardioides sp. B-3]
MSSVPTPTCCCAGSTTARRPSDRYRWDAPERQQVADLIDAASQADDETERAGLWKQALDIIAEEAPLYPILHTQVVTAHDADALEGFEGAATTGMYFLETERKD